MGKTSASKTEKIKADLGTVYALLEDVENYPKWMSEFKEAKVLEMGDDGHVDQAFFKMSSKGVTLEMTLAYEHTDDTISWNLVDGKMIEKSDGRYSLQDNGDGSTTLTYELENEVSVPLPGIVQKQLTKKVVSDTIKAVKKEAEG